METTTSDNNDNAGVFTPIYIVLNGEGPDVHSERFTMGPLRKGQVDTFTFASDLDIGNLKSVTVEMEGRDGWLMEKMVVTNLETLVQYTILNENTLWVDDEHERIVEFIVSPEATGENISYWAVP